MTDIKILGISGSLRKDSFNRAALRVAAEMAPAGVALSTFELHDIPIYNQDVEATPPASVLEFKHQITSSDAILFVTPEYNYSISGVLKNAIDWASRPYGQSAWLGKPAAIMGASSGNLGTARAQYHLRQILVTLNMPTVNQPEVMISNAAQRFDQMGALTDEPTRQIIGKLLIALVDLTKLVSTNKDLRCAETLLL